MPKSLENGEPDVSDIEPAAVDSGTDADAEESAAALLPQDVDDYDADDADETVPVLDTDDDGDDPLMGLVPSTADDDE